MRWSSSCRRTTALALAFALGAATAARAETAWVKDEVRLNLRTGAGLEFRIVGAVKTGDSVEIVTRGDDWTEVRSRDGNQGWIPGGFLQPDPPAVVGLARAEAEASDLRERAKSTASQLAELKARYDEVAAADAGQREEIARLTRENLELRAGARWPEWIAGASILFVGSLLGVLAHRSATRRRAPRIRI
jgi:SH3 domain protein